MLAQTLNVLFESRRKRQDTENPLTQFFAAWVEIYWVLKNFYLFLHRRTETANDDTISSGWKLPEQAKVDGMPDPEDLSQNMRKMLTLFENAENSAPSVQLGRFDIDGSYEINLLSYT